MRTMSRLLLAMVTVTVTWPATITAAAPRIRSCLDHVIALSSDGSVYEWGTLQPGLSRFSFDFGEALPYSSDLTRAVGLSVKDVACTSGSSFVLLNDGSVWAYGWNHSGQLALDPFIQISSPFPIRIEGLPPIAAISASMAVSETYVAALDAAGQVWAWGDNGAHQIASPASDFQRPLFRPSRLDTPDGSRITAVAAGREQLLLLDSAGAVWVRGTERDYARVEVHVDQTFRRVQGLPPIASIAAGNFVAFAIDRQRRLWAWGDNAYGALGIGFSKRTEDPDLHRVPSQVPGLADVLEVSPGYLHGLALRADGSIHGWGINDAGALGLGTAEPLFEVRNPQPARIMLSARLESVHASMGNSMAISETGAVYAWGWNDYGRLGDGTFANRLRPSPVMATTGLGYLDLTPENALVVAPESIPALDVLATGSLDRSAGTMTATVELLPRGADRTLRANAYVFALAPADLVKSSDAAFAFPMGKAQKDGALVPCVLAQLTTGGRLGSVSAADIRAFVADVEIGNAQALRILDGVAIANIAGATFYVGYGSSADAMLAGGTSRSVVSTGDRDTGCRPEAPETGWWWNPAQGGRGYSVEVRGDAIFFAAFHYDVSGRSTWHVATGRGLTLDGALYSNKPLYAASGGQTLGGAYGGKPTVSEIGKITLAFADKSTGTMIWPGGAVPIERFDIVPNGLAAAPKSGQPESGWWWNPDEDGRGFFMEWQNGTIDLAGYMYDEQGNPVWYLGVYETPDIRAVSGNWWSYANGQAMGGAYKPATRVNDNVAPVSITFSGPDAALMTLPNGRTTGLRRHRF